MLSSADHTALLVHEMNSQDAECPRAGHSVLQHSCVPLSPLPFLGMCERALQQRADTSMHDRHFLPCVLV